MSVLQGSPSVLPVNNPAMRVYHYDTYSNYFGQLKDFDQYYLNLTDANINNITTWKIEYSMRNEYSMNDITIDGFRNLVENMMGSAATNGTKYFKKYRNNFNVRSPAAANQKAFNLPYEQINSTINTDPLYTITPSSTHPVQSLEPTTTYNSADVTDVPYDTSGMGNIFGN